jgi:hypothetical protein
MDPQKKEDKVWIFNVKVCSLNLPFFSENHNPTLTLAIVGPLCIAVAMDTINSTLELN